MAFALLGIWTALTPQHDLRDFDGARVGTLETEMWRSYCDNVEAGEILGWQPKVSLTEGLIRTLHADAPAWRGTVPREAPPLGESL